MFPPYYYALNWIDIIFPAWREIGVRVEEFLDEEVIALLWYFSEIWNDE